MNMSVSATKFRQKSGTFLAVLLPLGVIFLVGWLTYGLSPLNLAMSLIDVVPYQKLMVSGIPATSQTFPLEPVHLMGAPAPVKFIPADHFVINDGTLGALNIKSMSDTFRIHFLDANLPVVPGKASLKIYQVVYNSAYDIGLVTALGPNYETYLSDIWAALSRQTAAKNCVFGGILSATAPNIFFLKDEKGDPWQVTLRCGSGYDYPLANVGWYIDASPVQGRNNPYSGTYVISRGP